MQHRLQSRWISSSNRLKSFEKFKQLNKFIEDRVNFKKIKNKWPKQLTFGGLNGYSAGNNISILNAPLLYGAVS